jgi:predicted RNase H-like nuclease (RuvC/YqgF family)
MSMKIVQNVLAVVVLVMVAAIAYQYLTSSSLTSRLADTERWIQDSKAKIESVEQETHTQRDVIQKQEKEIASHSESLGTQGKEIVDLKARVTAAEAKIMDLARSAEADRAEIDHHRAEIEKLRGDVEAVLKQKEDLAARQKQVDDLHRDLKKSLERSNVLERNSTELERRLVAIEKQLGIERPAP